MATSEGDGAKQTRVKEPKWVLDPPKSRQSVRLEVRKEGKVLDVLRAGKKRFAVLGRNGDVCDFMLEHPSISRQHAAIGYDQHGSLHLLNLAPAHGTWVGSRKVEDNERVRLANGDELCFGASTRKYIVKGLPEPKPAPTSSPAAAAAPAAESAGDMQPPGQDLRASLPAAFGRKGESAVDAADDEGQADSGSASVLDSFAMKQPAPAATGISFGQISRPAGRTAASAEPGAAEPAKKSRAEVEEAIRSMQEDPGEASRAVVQRAREAGALREGGKGRRGDGGAVEEEGDEDEDDEEDEDEEEGGDGGGARVQSVAESLRLPISHEALLSGHRKTVTCVAVDPAGSRVATGSFDYDVKLWDFGGMDQSHQAFRSFEPLEGNPVNAAAWTCTGDKLVVSTVGSKIRVFDRDAAPLLTTVRGDPYLADVARTKGHASAIAEVTTHPTDKDSFLSCGQDSTMRLWNVNGRRNLGDLVNSAVIRARSANNTRVPVTCCAFTVTANAVMCGCEDGSLQLWQTRAKFTRPDRNVRAAHAGAVTRLRCGRDGHTLATRGMDDTVRVWDLRRLKSPVRTLGGVPTLLATAGLDFSPDTNTLVAGTNVKPGGEDRAELLFWNLAESGQDQPAYRVPLGVGVPATAVCWHPRINQLFVGDGSGTTRVLYNPALSTKGALLSCKRPVKRASDADFVPNLGEIHLPNALPMFKDQHAPRKRRRREEEKEIENKKRHVPEPQPSGPDTYMGSFNPIRNFIPKPEKAVDIINQDPREELLKFKGRKGPSFTERAYEGYAPNPVFAEQTLEQELEEIDQKEEEEEGEGASGGARSGRA